MIEPIRVLQVYPQMNNAGTERVILNLYKNLDHSIVQFDFLCERPGELDEAITQMGGHFYYIYNESKIEYYRELLQFFTSHPEYHIIHTHTHARMGIVLRAAKKTGVKCRIAHSHNARNDLPKIAWAIKGITSLPIELNANRFFACSKNAAKWLFPHKLKDCEILYNGIDLNSYLFNHDVRTKKRKELGIPDDVFVMIHVGRFATQKNHRFLIEIANEYASKHNDWKLLLVGEGPLQDEVKGLVNNYGLTDHCCFLGSRNDVSELLSASDLFVFPSLHEGLGIVVIEAQASAIPCIVSDAVPEEADMDLGLLNRISLRKPPLEWVAQIDAAAYKKRHRNEYEESILTSKYNIKAISSRIRKFYLSNY